MKNVPKMREAATSGPPVQNKNKRKKKTIIH